ncbi:MAG: 2-C-methyl-D-erythritol 4-phosphate cytidylyltransferase [Thermodesulfobacteriota bacterium]|nr:2-C-methyl-D-erythritol 4-phosphate cytidylyltransferase [Thermodesulfobacteriota bacterium]
MSVIVLIPAAGLGRRMGGSVSKQYLSLDGRPILAHTVALFDSHPRVDHIYVIAPENQLDFCRDECVEPYRFDKVRDIIIGGEKRQDSVRHGVLGCHAQPGDILVIHDGVRPLFPASQLDAVLEAVIKTGACVVGVPVKDTIKRVQGDVIVATPPREELWAAHTPQAFRYELIHAAHIQAQQQGYCGTDDASLLEWQGVPVTMIEGSYRNIKITTPEDLLIAEAFLATSSEECC